MTGNFQKDVLEIREDGPEVGHTNVILGEAMNHLRHEIIARASYGETLLRAGYRLHLWDCAKVRLGSWVGGRQDYGPLRAVSRDEALRRIHVNNPAAFDNGHPVAEPLRF